jgi:hypothetical protein
VFKDWDSFYLLIGSAAGALIGLLFVVATLTSHLDAERVEKSASLYMTPLVLHFGVVLVLSAITMAPHVHSDFVMAAIGLAAAGGFAVALRVAVYLRLGKLIQPPHWSDFWWYGVGPAVTYLALGLAAASVRAAPSWAAELIAATLVGLLLLTVRNAWDLVIWMAPRAEHPEQLS